MASGTFSWKKALKHAAGPVLLFVIAMGALSTKAANPEKFGEGVGRALVFVFGGEIGRASCRERV